MATRQRQKRTRQKERETCEHQASKLNIEAFFNTTDIDALETLLKCCGVDDLVTAVCQSLVKRERGKSQKQKTDVVQALVALDMDFDRLVFTVFPHLRSAEAENLEKNPFSGDRGAIADTQLLVCATVLQIYLLCYQRLAQAAEGLEDRSMGIGPLGLATVLVEQWPDMQDTDLKNTCFGLFQVLCETFADLRPQFGRVCVLNLLVQLGQSESKHASTISQLHKYRDILPLIDFEEPTADFLKSHLIRCFSNADALGSDVGRRFLTFVLGSVHVQLTAQIMDWIRSVLPNFRLGSTMVKALSGVLFNAWNLSEAAIRLQMELSVQTLAEHALLCTPKVAAKFRELLFEFYHKGHSSSTEIVYRIFAPLLYRHLTVRFNATAFFSVAFPLVNTGLPTGEYEAEIERQYATLVRLAEDAHPEVRRVAVQGICRVLLAFWEMVPLDKTTALLDVLLMRAAKDRSSPHVRAASLEGLMVVLDNPMSHAALTTLLPKISSAVDDMSPIVRKGMANLLSRASLIPNFQLVSIVPVTTILQRLVHDTLLGRLEARSLRLRGMDHHKESDIMQSAVALARLMFHSVLGLEELPKQVERVLLMAEKFPLALLALVDLTAEQLDHLVRTRLAAAIFHFAVRKGRDVLHVLESGEAQIDVPAGTFEDEDKAVDETVLSQRRLLKYTHMASTLLTITSLLLPSFSVYDDTKRTGRKKKPSSGPKAVKEEEAKLVRFLSTNFQRDAFQALLLPESPLKAEAFQLLVRLPQAIVVEETSWLQPLACNLLEDLLDMNSDSITTQDIMLRESLLRFYLKSGEAKHLVELFWKQSFEDLKQQCSNLKGDAMTAEKPTKAASKRRATTRHKRKTPEDTTGCFRWTKRQHAVAQRAIRLLHWTLSDTTLSKDLVLSQASLILDDAIECVLAVTDVLCRDPERLFDFLKTAAQDSSNVPSLIEFLSVAAEMADLLSQVVLQYHLIVDEPSQTGASELLTTIQNRLVQSLARWPDVNFSDEETNELELAAMSTNIDLSRRLLKTLMVAVLFDAVRLSCTDLAQLMVLIFETSRLPLLQNQNNDNLLSPRQLFIGLTPMIALLADSGKFAMSDIMELIEAALFALPGDITLLELQNVLLRPSGFLRRHVRAGSSALKFAAAAVEARLVEEMKTMPNDFQRHRIISEFLACLTTNNESPDVSRSDPAVQSSLEAVA